MYQSAAKKFFTPIPAAPISTVAPCTHCKGRIVHRPHGTTYCCKEAELDAYKEAVTRLEGVLDEELKDSLLDDHMRRSLGYMMRTIRQAQGQS